MKTPLQNKVFIRPEFLPEKIGSIILPKNIAEQLPNSGTVVAISEKAANTAEFKVGNRVIYDRYKSNISQVSDDDGNALAVVEAGDVMAVFQ